MATVRDYDTFLIRTVAELDEVRSRFETASVLSVDFETESLDDLTVWGVGLAIPPTAGYRGCAVYIACESHDSVPLIDCELDWDEHVKPFLESLFAQNKHWVGQNLKFDTIVLRSHRFDNMPTDIFDTMIGSWMLSNQHRKHNLQEIAWRFLRFKIDKDLMEIRKDRESDPKLYWIDMQRYGTIDVIVPLLLRDKMLVLMEKHKVKKAAKEIEMPMVAVTAELELQGVPIDIPFLKELKERTEAERDEISSKIHKMVGYEFNVGSTVQLAEAMFDNPDGLNIAPHEWMNRGKPRGTKNPKPGAWPTNDGVLKSYSHPICALVLRWRSRDKLIGTYCRNAIALAEMAADGRLRVSWNQTGTSTGRYSSSRRVKPKFNLQNLPRESGTIRKSIKASPGFVIVACDYSQIELRLMAHYSGDPQMVDAYMKAMDVHIRTAAKVAGVPESEVTKEQRAGAKPCNFGFLYGMSAKRFKDYAKNDYGVVVTDEESIKFRESFFDLYKGIAYYHDNMRDYIASHGYTRNIFGEKRFLPGYNSSDSYEAWKAWSEGVNFTIQGSAAALVKKAMLDVSRALVRPFGYRVSGRYDRVVTLWKSQDNLSHEVRMMMQVHDELVFEAREEIAEPFSKWLKLTMEKAVTGFRVPIVAETAIGPTFEDAK